MTTISIMEIWIYGLDNNAGNTGHVTTDQRVIVLLRLTARYHINLSNGTLQHVAQYTDYTNIPNNKERNYAKLAARTHNS